MVTSWSFQLLDLRPIQRIASTDWDRWHEASVGGLEQVAADKQLYTRHGRARLAEHHQFGQLHEMTVRRLKLQPAAIALLAALAAIGLVAWARSAQIEDDFQFLVFKKYLIAAASSQGRVFVCFKSRLPRADVISLAVAPWHVSRPPLGPQWMDRWSTGAVALAGDYEETVELDRSALCGFVLQREGINVVPGGSPFPEPRPSCSTSAWCVALPYPTIPVTLTVLTLFPATVLWRRRKWQNGGFCRHCGYDLRASHERCPECGAACKAASPAGASPAAGD